MKRSYCLQCFWCLLVLISIIETGLAQSVISIQDERELFVDNYLIDRLDSAKVELHSPIYEGSVLKLNNPWEGAFSLYSTIIKDGDLFRAYYRGWNNIKGKQRTCYAESKDGMNWQKPSLGIVEINGSNDNNVILDTEPITHNFSPFIDKNPGIDPEQKYKAVGGNRKTGLVPYSSPDGIHWKRLKEEGVITKGAFDSQNVSFWSESEREYICYFRTFTEKKFRSVSRTTSKDFINWREPVEMTYGDTPSEHLYTQQTSPYYRAPHIYVAIGARFMPNRQVVSDAQAEALNVNPNYYNDCSDAFFMTSRGGNTYDRTFMESFIRPGIGLENWVSRTNYPALNVVQTSDTEMSVYVNEDYAQSTAHLARYSMRIDGFASLAAGYSGGEMITKPFTFEGKALEINYSTSAAGSIKIEIQDEKGNSIPGFTLEDSEEIIGNEIKRLVTWNGQSDVSKLADKPIRLRIYLKDADLYSIKFNN